MTAAPRATFIDFVAFADDATLSGRVEMAAGRLSDLLNAHEEYVLRDVLVSGYDGGRGYEFHELAIPGDDLLVVQRRGPVATPVDERGRGSTRSR